MMSRHGWSHFKCSEESVLVFCCHLISRGLESGSVCKCVAGVSFFLKLLGEPSINLFFVIRQMLKGVRRNRWERSRVTNAFVEIMYCLF